MSYLGNGWYTSNNLTFSNGATYNSGITYPVKWEGFEKYPSADEIYDQQVKKVPPAPQDPLAWLHNEVEKMCARARDVPGLRAPKPPPPAESRLRNVLGEQLVTVNKIYTYAWAGSKDLQVGDHVLLPPSDRPGADVWEGHVTKLGGSNAFARKYVIKKL